MGRPVPALGVGPGGDPVRLVPVVDGGDPVYKGVASGGMVMWATPPPPRELLNVKIGGKLALVGHFRGGGLKDILPLTST